MGLLNKFFGSTEFIAQELKSDDESIIKYWKDYNSTISRKKEIILKIDLNNLHQNLQELQQLLEIELVDIASEEKTESEIISDLDSIEHSKKIKRIDKLEQSLGYAETKYKYAYELLHNLHLILKSQIQLVMQLKKSMDVGKIIIHLKSQLELELKLIEKIAKIETFQNLFTALVKGEHIVATMDLTEKKLLKSMQTGISKIFSNEISEGITYEWAMSVFDAIEDKVHEGVSNGTFSGYHPDIDFEFTNRPEFVHLAREKILILKKRKVSDTMINVFVHLFREWYNYERD